MNSISPPNPARQQKNSTPRYSDSGIRPETPKAHQLFRRARATQFPTNSRKRRIVQERLKRLARCLATFDTSGDCRNVYPKTKNILRALHDREVRYYDAGDQLPWGRRCLFVYLRRLRECGVLTSGGLTRWQGARIRALHPEALCRESRTTVGHESRTTGKAESRTRKAVTSEKLFKDLGETNHHPQNPQTDDDSPTSFESRNPSEQSKTSEQSKIAGREERATETPNAREAYAKRIAVLKATARKNILLDTKESPEAVDAILETVVQRAADAKTIIATARYLETGFTRHLEDMDVQIEAELEAEEKIGVPVIPNHEAAARDAARRVEPESRQTVPDSRDDVEAQRRRAESIERQRLDREADRRRISDLQANCAILETADPKLLRAFRCGRISMEEALERVTSRGRP